MNLQTVAEVAAAGGAGAATRAAVDLAVRARVPMERAPLATLSVNVSGSLLLGVLAGTVAFHHSSSTISVVGGTGFCGGYTTFSTASVEAVRLFAGGARAPGAWLVVASVVGTLSAAMLGWWLGSL